MILNTIINTNYTYWANIIKSKKIIINRYIDNIDHYIKNKNKKRKLLNWLLRKKRIKHIFGFNKPYKQFIINIKNIDKIYTNTLFINNNNNMYIKKNSEFIEKKIKLFNQLQLNKKNNKRNNKKFKKNKWKKY